MIDEYFEGIALPPNIFIYEEKTFNFRWLRVGGEKILQQLVMKKYSDHFEQEWRDIETEEKQDD